MRYRKVVRIGKPITTPLLYDKRPHDSSSTVGKCRMKSVLVHYPMFGTLATGSRCHINTHLNK